MIDDFGDLLSILSEVLSSPDLAAGADAVAGEDSAAGAYWSDLTLGDEKPHMLAGSVPWESSSMVSYLEDWDGDGVPNYADHWFGPGAQSPFGAATEPIDSDALEMPHHPDTAPRHADAHAEEHIPFGTDAGHDGSHSAVFVDAPTEGDGAIASTPMEIASDENVGGVWDHEASALSPHDFSPTVTVGDPAGDAAFWHVQEDINSCAVAAQRGVIEAVTGQCIPERDLAELAESCGWYDPGCGTSPDAVGSLLEACNVPVDRSYDSSIEALYDALAHGRKVIVGLDSNEIMNQIVDGVGNPVELPDMGHAVWVTGMEMDAHGCVQVVLNDPGYSGGAGVRVPLEHFENAWDDFGRYSVVTRSSEAALV